MKPNTLIATVMTRDYPTLLFRLLLALCLTNCGGGSGAGGDASTVGAVPSSTTTTNQSQTTLTETTRSWTLDRTSPETIGLETSQVNAVLSHIFTDPAVQSVMLVKDGYIIGERFSETSSAESLGTSWSVAKSFYGAAIGIAIDQGWIQGPEQKASEFLTEWQDTNKADITIGQLLSMQSGITDTVNLYWAEDQTTFAINYPKTQEAGSRFFYSNPTSQLFEPILRRATGLDAHAFLRQNLLTPIGIETESIGMWLDRTGNHPLTYMGLDMPPEAFARFGLLMARGGLWAGRQILSAAFVSESLTTKSPFYGYQWWILNQSYFGQPVPATLAAALGLDGQKIYVWPEADLVLVVLTDYAHSANQGYVLSDLNFPNTCGARGSCPGSTTDEVPSFNEFELIRLLNELH
jgi:CubicO group peptidase (beta-lactamase class C family)